MTRDEAVARIEQALAFHSGQATEIVTALKDAQVELEAAATLPWFLLSGIQSLTTTSGVETVALPSDFLQEWEGDPLHYFSTVSGVSDADLWTALAKEDFEFLRDTLPGEGTPQAYALDNDNYYIFPTPDDTYTLKNIYYATDTVLDSDVTNLWLTHIPFLMIGIAGFQIATALRDKGAIAVFSAWEQKYRAQLTRKNEARAHASQRYIMGGPD